MLIILTLAHIGFNFEDRRSMMCLKDMLLSKYDLFMEITSTHLYDLSS